MEQLFAPAQQRRLRHPSIIVAIVAAITLDQAAYIENAGPDEWRPIHRTPPAARQVIAGVPANLQMRMGPR